MLLLTVALSLSTPSPILQAYLEKRIVLVRYFTARARDATMAEEVVQDLYLKIAALDPNYVVDNPTAFLFRSATNIWLNRIRGAGRDQRRSGQWLETHHTSLGDDIIVDEPSAEAQVSARQQLANIRRALTELPDKTQDIFRLHKMDGMQQTEVAAKLGISKSSVEKHLASALKFLMARINPDHGP